MITIHKYTLTFSPYQAIDMRKGKIIKAGYQRCNKEWHKTAICLWVVVDDDAPIVRRKFVLNKTGQELELVNDNGNLEHIDTLLTGNGQFVIHLFERTIDK